MKKVHTISLCVAVAAVCVLGGMSPPASAQITASPQPQWRQVYVHYVRPDMIAYWIDPAHQPVPPEYQNHQMYPIPFPENTSQYIPQIKAAGNSFSGQVVAIDAQNGLSILSSQEDFDRDKKIIELLDQPLQQVDVEARFLYGDSPILNTILPKSLDWHSATENNAAYKMAVVSDDADSLVQRLRATGKIQEINSPRVTTLDNLPANLWSITTIPINVELKTDYPGQILPIQSIDGEQIGLGVTNMVRVIPVINSDGSVTMSVALVYEAMLVDNRDWLSAKAHHQPIQINNKEHDGVLIKGLYDTPVTFNCTINKNQSIIITGNRSQQDRFIIVSAIAQHWNRVQ